MTIFDYADTNVVMFARMFNKRCVGYKALGYEIVMPLSTEPGLPSNVALLREKKLDETYSESVNPSFLIIGKLEKVSAENWRQRSCI